MDTSLPVVGTAVRLHELPTYIDWILADQRDLEMPDAADIPVLDGDWKQTCREINALLDGYTGRFGLHGPAHDLNLAAWEPRMMELVRDRMKRGLEMAAELSATHMVIHSPLLFLGFPQKPYYVQERIDLTLKTLQPIVEIAEQIKCMLVIENIHDRNARHLSDLVRAFESPYVRQSLDCGHAQVNHMLGGPPPDQYIYEAGDLLAHIHLQDVDGYADRHWGIGYGSINWFAIFDAIKQIGSQPRLILELRDRADAYRSAEWLQAHGLAR